MDWSDWTDQLVVPGQKHGEGTWIRADGGSYTGAWAQVPSLPEWWNFSKSEAPPHWRAPI